MKTMNKFRSNDQARLKIVSDEICDDIESLLNHFNLDYKIHHKMITMCCPIHGGDNASALNLYPDGDRYRGNWKCRTHGCEEVFKGSIIGFIRGIISNQKYGWRNSGDSICSFNEAVDFAASFINKDISKIKISRSDQEKKQFTSVINYLNDKTESAKSYIRRDQIVATLQIPAQYYIDRNYTAEILSKYDVGLCCRPEKEMSNRIVVPIYDNDYQYMVGCSGRSIYEKCCSCAHYHDPSSKCPSGDFAWKFSKWKHSTDFKSQNYLYNFWFAKEHILKTSIAIIVESPGNVWRLEENGIHNSVAIFGSSMSDRQKILLDSSGAMNLIILTDNDAAGQKAAQQIRDKCQNTYRIFVPTITKPDVGDMTPEEIEKEIKKYIENIK